MRYKVIRNSGQTYITHTHAMQENDLKKPGVVHGSQSTISLKIQYNLADIIIMVIHVMICCC